jgi:hypothetical protein
MHKQAKNQDIKHPGNYVSCIFCGNIIEIPDDFAEQYFLSKPIQCRKCGRDVNWWKAILDSISNCPPYYYDAFAVLNVKYTKTSIDLVPNSYIEIQPTELVPPDSNILNVMYGPRPDGLIPLEDHGDIPNRHSVPDRIRLYVASAGEGEADRASLDIFVAWLPKGHDDTWHSLYQALEAYTYERYESAVVTANTALNLTMDHTIRRRLKYGYKLNVLLPKLVASVGFPKLPDHIHSAMDRLRDYRNKVVHEWRLSPSPSREDIAECLCAAAFGVNYLRLVQPLL